MDCCRQRLNRRSKPASASALACAGAEPMRAARESLVLDGIAAGEAVPADVDQVGEHPQAVAQHVDFCARIVSPANRNFRGAKSTALGQEQQLGVESESFDSLLVENHQAAFAHEGLESALGVLKRQSRKDSHPGVEDHSRDFPETGLATENQGGGEGAR